MYCKRCTEQIMEEICQLDRHTHRDGKTRYKILYQCPVCKMINVDYVFEETPVIRETIKLTKKDLDDMMLG